VLTQDQKKVDGGRKVKEKLMSYVYAVQVYSLKTTTVKNGVNAKNV
jgi:hypothetical protein